MQGADTVTPLGRLLKILISTRPLQITSFLRVLVVVAVYRYEF